MKLTKGESVKEVSNEKNIEILKLDGWVSEDQKLDRDALKEKAAELGIEFKSNIKTDKLIALIENKE